TFMPASTATPSATPSRSMGFCSEATPSSRRDRRSAGSRPRRRARRQRRWPRPLDDLKARLGVSPRTALRMRTFDLGGQRVAEASHQREVSLKGLSPKLAKVVALGAEPALIGH